MTENKTNAMRLLDRAGVPYILREISTEDGAVDGVTAARLLGMPPERVYKTLVTAGDGGNYVFLIPVAGTLDLKKAAASVGEKALKMMPQAKLFPLTGYVHGGCSPVGMKKRFPTVLDESARDLTSFVCSGGKPGKHLELSPQDLALYLHAVFAAVTVQP